MIQIILATGFKENHKKKPLYLHKDCESIYNLGYHVPEITQSYNDIKITKNSLNINKNIFPLDWKKMVFFLSTLMQNMSPGKDELAEEMGFQRI